MFYSYLQLINHNKYLKLGSEAKSNFFTNNLISINVMITFISKDSNNNNKILLLYSLFLFKTLFFVNGNYIIVKKSTKHILGLKFVLKHQLMHTFLKIYITNFLNQPEVLNRLSIKSFDYSNNCTMMVLPQHFHYLDRILVNPYFKRILLNFKITSTFIFSNNNFYNNLFYLNFLKFYFIN